MVAGFQVYFAYTEFVVRFPLGFDHIFTVDFQVGITRSLQAESVFAFGSCIETAIVNVRVIVVLFQNLPVQRFRLAGFRRSKF
ncbi:hypothetical protein D3C87_1910820 [compost metagenome]